MPTRESSSTKIAGPPQRTLMQVRLAGNSNLVDQVRNMFTKCLAILNPGPQTARQGVIAAMSQDAFATYTVSFAVECFTGTVLLVGFNVDTIRL